MPRQLRASLWSVGSNCPRSTCVPNLKIVALTVCEISKALRNFEIGSRHQRHAHLGGNLHSVNKNCQQPVNVRNLKSVALSATKIWHIFLLRTNWPRDLDLWPFDPESGVQVTCDMGYLYANFSLPRPLCSWPRPDVRDRRQTDRRQTPSSHDAPAYGVDHNNTDCHCLFITFLSCTQHADCQCWQHDIDIPFLSVLLPANVVLWKTRCRREAATICPRPLWPWHLTF